MAEGITELPGAFGCAPLGLLGDDPLCFQVCDGLLDGQRPQGLDFLACCDGSCGRFASLPVWADRAHSDVGAVCLGGAVFVDKKRDPFAFVPFPHTVALRCRGGDGPRGIEHARIVFGVVRGLPSGP